MNRLFDFFTTLLECLLDFGSWVKTLCIASLTIILNLFAPISNFLYVLLILSSLDIFAGLLADRGDWQKKKAIKAFVYLCLYFALVCLSFLVGIMMRQSEESMAAFSSWVTWVMNYFYVANILRNLNLRFADNKVIAFFYWAVTVKFISNINFMEEYTRKQYKEDNR